MNIGLKILFLNLQIFGMEILSIQRKIILFFMCKHGSVGVRSLEPAQLALMWVESGTMASALLWLFCQ